VLVPSPFVTADQQTRNARPLVAAGGAILVPDAELDGTRLAAEVDGLLGDAVRLEEMARAARAWARPDAASAIAALASVHARG
jgi:UDP-N-acetylglucosamine--N-acetylmuramyl-(pentapeptide) pyrophosphoryl-undecaprenol N-acetylglucosamine transferase